MMGSLLDDIAKWESQNHRVTFYCPDAVLADIETAIRTSGQSKSRWLVTAAREYLRSQAREQPEDTRPVATQNNVPTMRELGAIIRACRTKRGLTLMDVAAHAGMHYTTLQRLESGGVLRMPAPETLKRVCDAIGVGITDVLSGSHSELVVQVNSSKVQFNMTPEELDRWTRSMVG